MSKNIKPLTTKFEDHPEFTPHDTSQVLQMVLLVEHIIRKIRSSVTGKTYDDAWKEFPKNWFEGLE